MSRKNPITTSDDNHDTILYRRGIFQTFPVCSIIIHENKESKKGIKPPLGFFFFYNSASNNKTCNVHLVNRCRTSKHSVIYHSIMRARSLIGFVIVLLDVNVIDCIRTRKDKTGKHTKMKNIYRVNTTILKRLASHGLYLSIPPRLWSCSFSLSIPRLTSSEAM